MPLSILQFQSMESYWHSIVGIDCELPLTYKINYKNCTKIVCISTYVLYIVNIQFLIIDEHANLICLESLFVCDRLSDWIPNFTTYLSAL